MSLPFLNMGITIIALFNKSGKLPFKTESLMQVASEDRAEKGRFKNILIEILS